MFVNLYSFCTHEKCDELVIREGIPINAGLDTLRYEGDFEKKGREIQLLPYRSRGNITILSITSRARVISSNESIPNPHFEKSNTWIGADGPGLVHQDGRNKDHTKKQLFRLKERETILFFDAHKEVTAITANTSGKPPICCRATNEQVADYILSEASKRKGTRRALDWCFYALEELNCQTQMNEFLRNFPRS